MKTNCTTLILCLFISILHFSCYRVTTEANSLLQGFSVAQIVGTWKITAASSDKAYDWDGNGVTETNMYSTWTDCQRDNLYQFVIDHTGHYKTTCSDSKTGIWLLTGTTIVWTPDGSGSQYEKIEALTSNMINTTSTIQVPNCEIFVITKVWTRQ